MKTTLLFTYFTATTAVSLRGHATSGQSENASTTYLHNKIHRQLSLHVERDDTCDDFNQFYMESLATQLAGYDVDDWVAYACNKVTNEMVFRPAMENLETIFNTDGDDNTYSDCAIEMTHAAVDDLAALGMDFAAEGGLGANQDLCKTIVAEEFSSLQRGDGRRLELFTLLAILLIGGGLTIALGALAGSGVALAAIGGAFEDAFYIVHDASNLVLQVSGCDDGDRLELAEIDRRDFQGLSDHQRFRVGENDQIISELCDKAIHVARGSCDIGSHIRIWTETGSLAQQWSQGDDGELFPMYECPEDRVISVENGNFNVGETLILDEHRGDESQLFTFRNARTYNGGDVRTTAPRIEDRLEDVDDGFSICNIGTGNCLYSPTKYSVGVSDTEASNWMLETVVEGTYRFNGPGILGSNIHNQIFLAHEEDTVLFDNLYGQEPERLQWTVEGAPCPSSASNDAICGRLVSRAFGKALEDGVVNDHTGYKPHVVLANVRSTNNQIWVIDH